MQTRLLLLFILKFIGEISVDGVLTTDCCRLLEDLGNLRVHLDHEVSFNGDFLVTCLYLLPDPLVKGLTNDGRADITDPLLGRLG